MWRMWFTFMWSSLELSPSKTPILQDDEKQIDACRQVGLYNNDTKSQKYAQGWVYLTTKRLCYVDDSRPEENSIYTNLSQIDEATYIPRFLRQSAKIAISLSDKPAESLKRRTWVCPICTFSNVLSSKFVYGSSALPVCENCGVQASMEALDSMFETSPANASNDNDGTVCPRCTFKNHPYLRNCEICGTVLKEHKVVVPLGSNIKLSFRADGSKKFYEKLIAQINHAGSVEETVKEHPASQATDVSKGLGIRRLELASSNLIHSSSADIDDAFKDVRRISAEAQNLQKLLEAYSRANPDGVKSLGLGLESALVFRDMARDEKTYLEQLARQISEFLEVNNILEKEGGVMTLFDVYSMYNRVRGLELIAPDDVVKALDKLEPLGMPIRLRTLKSGRKVVVNRYWASPQDRLASWISKLEPWRQHSGVNALDVTQNFGWSILIATEELELGEENGLLCRDESLSGTQYFLNLLSTTEPGLV